jgi:hypothetical protein
MKYHLSVCVAGVKTGQPRGIAMSRKNGRRHLVTFVGGDPDKSAADPFVEQALANGATSGEASPAGRARTAARAQRAGRGARRSENGLPDRRAI